MAERLSRRVQVARLLAAGMLAFFALAAYWTVRLATTEWISRQEQARWAELEPTQERAALRAAVAANPRDSGAWISLGLAAESAGQLYEAARDFGVAQEVDRQYLPAWSAANFYFRHTVPRHDMAVQFPVSQFWADARRAAAMA